MGRSVGFKINRPQPYFPKRWKSPGWFFAIRREQAVNDRETGTRGAMRSRFAKAAGQCGIEILCVDNQGSFVATLFSSNGTFLCSSSLRRIDACQFSKRKI